MIVERIFPRQSTGYHKWKKPIALFSEKLDRFGLIQLFSVWTLTVAGIVISMDIEDRFVYWEWSNWGVGLLKVILVTGLFIAVLKPKSLWSLGVRPLSNNEIGIHLGIGSGLIIFGFLSTSNPFNGVLNLVPYLLCFAGIIYIFQMKVELDETTGDWFAKHWQNKFQILGFSTILIFSGVALGFYLDDPIVSTAGMVSLPFPLIALLWPNHVRHLQRARFYPLFIFAMFLCVRAPWFLIPLSILFYFLRTVNYFRYGIIHPSFGVNLDEFY